MGALSYIVGVLIAAITALLLYYLFGRSKQNRSNAQEKSLWQTMKDCCRESL